MADVDMGTRVVGSFMILILLLVVFHTLVDPKFFDLLGLNLSAKRNVANVIEFLRPLFLLGIIILWSTMAYGLTPVSGFLVGLFGMVAYVLLTSDVFFMLIKLPSEIQTSLRMFLNFFSPIIVASILIGVIYSMIKFRGEGEIYPKIEVKIPTNIILIIIIIALFLFNFYLISSK